MRGSRAEMIMLEMNCEHRLRIYRLQERYIDIKCCLMYTSGTNVFWFYPFKVKRYQLNINTHQDITALLKSLGY